MMYSPPTNIPPHCRTYVPAVHTIYHHTFVVNSVLGLLPTVCNSRSELVLVMEYMSGGDLFTFIMKHREEGRNISEKVRLHLIGTEVFGHLYARLRLRLLFVSVCWSFSALAMYYRILQQYIYM